MQDHTFRSKISLLAQKSRKASRLYSAVRQVHNDPSSEYNQLQAAQWRVVNEELAMFLSDALRENSKTQELIRDVVLYRDRLKLRCNDADRTLLIKQPELVRISESGDFVKVAVLSKELLIAKAQQEALQAARNEIESCLKKVRQAIKPAGIRLPIEEAAPQNVIPLMRKAQR